MTETLLIPTTERAPSGEARVSFVRSERLDQQAHEARVLRAVAQVEAARELLNRATEGGHTTDFWERALEWAEDEEARARRALASFQKRDRESARRSFDFARALSSLADKHEHRLEPERSATVARKLPVSRLTGAKR